MCPLPNRETVTNMPGEEQSSGMTRHERRLTRFAILLSVLTVVLCMAQSALARSDYRWPRSQESGFIVSCLAKGSSGAFCICALRWLERRYSFQRITYVVKYEPVLFARIIDRARNACGG